MGKKGAGLPFLSTGEWSSKDSSGGGASNGSGSGGGDYGGLAHDSSPSYSDPDPYAPKETRAPVSYPLKQLAKSYPKPGGLDPFKPSLPAFKPSLPESSSGGRTGIKPLVDMTGGRGRGAGRPGGRQPSRMLSGSEQYDPFEESFEETPKPSAEMMAGFMAGMAMGRGMAAGMPGFDKPGPRGGRRPRPMPFGEMDDSMDAMPVGPRRPRSMLDPASMLEEPMLPPRGPRGPMGPRGPPRRLMDPYGPGPGMPSLMDPMPMGPPPPPHLFMGDPYFEDPYFGGPPPPRGALMAMRRRSAPGGVHPDMRHADKKRGRKGDGRPADRPVIKPLIEDSHFAAWKKKEGVNLGGAAMKILKGSKKQRGDQPRFYSKSQTEKRMKKSEERRQIMNNPTNVKNRKLFKMMLSEFFFFMPLTPPKEEKEKQKEEQKEEPKEEISPELAEELAQARQQVLVTEMDTW